MLHEIGGEISLEGSFTVEEELGGFAAVEHDGAEEAQIGGRERTAVDGDGLLAGGGISGDRAAIRIADSFDGELRIRWNRQENTNHSAFQKQTMVSGIAGGAGGAIRAINRREERVCAVRKGKAGAHILNAETHGVTRLVTGATGASIGAEALKEGAIFANGTVDVVRGDHAGRVKEWEKVRNYGGRKTAREPENRYEQNPLPRAYSCQNVASWDEIQEAPSF